MIESSAAYKGAVVGDFRRTLIRAVIDIIDPDIVYGAVSGSSQSGYSLPAKAIDRKFYSEDRYTTIKLNIWSLDASQD